MDTGHEYELTLDVQYFLVIYIYEGFYLSQPSLVRTLLEFGAGAERLASLSNGDEKI